MNQKKAIKAIFLTELWERFSYYGISAILILYIVQYFHLSPSQSYAIYGAYGALVYSTPIVGGYLQDRFLGTFYSVVVGATLIALGHFIILLPESSATPTHQIFFLGLAFVITGTGLFKPSIASVIGELYQHNPDGRERGYTLAYIGSNVGTIIAPIICAYVAVHYSYIWAFGLAGFGMIIGLIGFIINYRHFAPESFQAKAKLTGSRLLAAISVVTISIIMINAIFLALRHPSITGNIVEIIGAISFIVAMAILFKSTLSERRALISLLILTLFYIVFMILLQQTGSIMNVFTLQHVNRQVFGYTIPTGMFQSVEPLALVLIGLVWNKLTWAQKLSNTINSFASQFSFALIMMGLAFLIIAIPTWLTHKTLMSMFWINLSYSVMAFGELFIGPIGLAMVSTLAPKRYIGFFMGLWVLASAFANFSAAKVGMIANHGLAQGQTLSMPAYAQVYFALAMLGIVSGGVLFSIRGSLSTRS